MRLKNPFKTSKAGAADRRILFACIAFCAAGMLYSVFVSHVAMDGPRGAVLALGLTLAFVVGKSDSASQVYAALRKIAQVTEAPAQDKDYALEIERLKQRFKDLETQLKSSGADEKKMNWYLIWATAIATIVSAFGDIGCTWIMNLRGITPVK